jgi:hypothetical protein
MVTIELTSFDDVRRAPARVGEFARAAGLQDPEAAVMTTGELANNHVRRRPARRAHTSHRSTCSRPAAETRPYHARDRMPPTG